MKKSFRLPELYKRPSRQSRLIFYTPPPLPKLQTREYTKSVVLGRITFLIFLHLYFPISPVGGGHHLKLAKDDALLLIRGDRNTKTR